MAQKKIVIYIDDITGEETGDGATHTFALDGVQYELDLSPESYDKLLEDFGPYLQAARKVGSGRRQGARPGPHHHREGPTTAEIREWASANGHEVSGRGRISAEVREAYEAAH
ncbi:Lsr2 family protein [Streptomyces sp. NPDC059985]|uniref:histone-like nucleoid-structuring protein Lsr2 n=1 Tax=Streptomyces sp. NPDC059985 TaxID=3347025 RepID=UPI0036A68DA9